MVGQEEAGEAVMAEMRKHRGLGEGNGERDEAT